ncbi:MAG: hypothetical protein CMJ58_02580 [Planctomycetaceae bacterium]|nr:hypothetical protein [Planctomycetaceae bacterium]
MAPTKRLSICSALLALAALAGCNQPAGDSEQTKQLRTSLMLAEEPDGGQTVLDVRYALLGEPAEHDHEHDHAAGEADHDHAEDVGDDEEEVETHDHEHDHGIEALEHEHEHPVADDDHSGDDHDHDAAAADDHDHEHDHGDDEGDDHDHGDEAAPAGGSLEVVMVGIVGAVTNPYSQTQPDFPFVKGQATVFLSDPGFVAEQNTDAHQHAPGEECAFCEAHAADAADAVALVRFVDDAGKPIKIDARDLLGLKPGQTLVVKGVAKAEAGDMLIVDATGAYIRE